jgi:hypothetical protein
VADSLQYLLNFVVPVETEPKEAIWLGSKAWSNEVLGKFNFEFHGEWLLVADMQR